MAEILQRDGTWTFDGDTLRLTPGRDKSVSLLRKTLGELSVPLGALAGISFEQGRRSGRLRLRLRDGSDPLLQATGGRLTDADDPYQLSVDADRFGVAEYVVDEIRGALLLDEVPTDAVDAYLLAGPAVPLSVSAGDGTVSFDGDRVRLEWNWKTEDAKAAAGARTLALTDIAGVEWQPSVGLENGYLRFTVRNAPTKAPPKYDPNSVELWGFKKDPLMALVAAAVQARLPHPAAPAPKQLIPSASPQDRPAPEEDHDALLRRLRELGDLHRSGVLTDEEFTLAKQAVLKRL
ncbi:MULTISPECIES: DUF4429 domain-containing protein [Streptomyces]|uniref:DUF4429 domain-containing protein n=1 Tax=Streptomyces caniscabiei TaxID=2746961 RepID=A0ABU4MXQ4_9ACTN|nr:MULTISPECIES: DUF4429 domain-containing protein [Streptomyces]MBE4739560.1 DUF4429 domain-containing protein [Streptomyces caniscabiei]MBE4760082.1 DUF4429 domain-containing protein [Streptomyces caniscabiei]MBE4772579.1 DUF4429 domain-containing protein [Streptomyces caniscabiei]MBE4784507.1 DUF4429 domain-containing protein [Streptomyces caniscabiei]MBE4798250.1 DUF4429 domain-containing protein [Streptomyces caniscabiei]